METIDSEKQVAVTILDQLGWKALYMLGAKGFVYDSRSVKFLIGGRKFKMIMITLNDLDYYDIRFIKIRANKVKEVVVDNVCVDQMHEVIENQTGLCLSL